MPDQSIALTLEAQVPSRVITKAEAERALDREEVRRLCARYGFDTVLTWLYQMRFNLSPEDRPVDSPETGDRR